MIKKKRISIFIIWMFSYILIMMIPMFFLTSSYIVTNDLLKGEINHSNYAMLEQIRMGIDSRLEEIEKLSTLIRNDKNVNSYLNTKFPMDRSILYKRQRLMEFFSTIAFSNKFIKDIHLYANNVEGFLNRTSYLEKELVFNYTKPHYNDFIEQALVNNYKYAEGNFRISNYNGNKELTFIKNIYYFSKDEINGVLVIELNDEILNEAISNFDIANMGNVEVTNGNDEIICTKKLCDNINEKDFVKINTHSNITDWQYITYIPEDIYWDKHKYLKKLIIAFMFISFFIGITLSYYFSNKNYTPIKIIMGEINNNSETDTQSNELVTIHNAVNSLYNDKKELNNTIAEQNTKLRQNFFKKMLEGSILIDDKVSCEMEYDNSSDIDFMVAIVYIFNSDYVNNSDIIKRLEESITNSSNDQYKTNLVMMSRYKYSIIINMEKANYEKYQIIKNQIIKIIYTIENQYDLKVNVALSDYQKGLTCISSLYSKAQNTLEYLLLSGNDSIACYDDIPNFNQWSKSYYFPMEQEIQLVNNMKTGNFKICNEIIDNIIERNLSILSVRKAKCLMFNMNSILVKTICQVDNLHSNKELLQCIEDIEKLFAISNINLYKVQLINVIKRICDINHNINDINNNQLINRITNFINDNYHDYNICVSKIADEFNINMSKLSKLFQMHKGIYLNHYIQTVRMQHAKELLLRDLSIQDVATKVGFSSSSVFIRNFKKIEGITPGKYKTINIEV